MPSMSSRRTKVTRKSSPQISILSGMYPVPGLSRRLFQAKLNVLTGIAPISRDDRRDRIPNIRVSPNHFKVW
jgi:hypothetical protein